MGDSTYDPTVVQLEVGGIAQFDCSGDLTSIGPRWKKWKTSFEFYSNGKGVKDAKQKRALLLHSAGPGVQEIYLTLPEGEVEEELNEYKKAVLKLDAHFAPHDNIPFERHQFRMMAQENSETVDHFIVRLTRQAENFDFGSTMREQIRDQVIDKCKNTTIRQKLLEKG